MSSSAGSSKDVGSERSASTAARNQQQQRDAAFEDGAEQNRTAQDGFFSCMYLLTKERRAPSWKLTAVQIALEAVQLFLVLYNATNGWAIAQDAGIWNAISWVLIRIPISSNLPYSSYVAILYVLLGAVISVVCLTAYMAVLLRRDEHASRDFARVISLLQIAAEWLFGILAVTIFDYLVYMFDCNWSSLPRAPMALYPQSNCAAMPHIGNMAAALVAALTVIMAALLLSVAGSDPNPCTRTYTASAHATIRFKVMLAKLVLVAVSGVLGSYSTVQGVVMLLATLYALWTHVIAMPYYHDFMNHLWVAIWGGLSYVAFLYAALKIDSRSANADFQASMSNNVLYGIFPVMLGFGVMSYYKLRAGRRPLAAFMDPPPGAKSKDIYRLKSPEQVEFLSRVVRKWDLDNVLDPQAVQLGESIIRHGLSQFPASPFLLTLYANFIIEVHKDRGRSMTQLQLGAKYKPSTFEQYFIYATEELNKQLKDEGGMDLMAYLSYQQAYRGVVRSHKLALQAQRRFWQELLREDIKVEYLENVMRLMDSTEKRASLGYRRLLERFPKSGKLLRAYGKFLEDVQNEPYKALTYYCEASKVGLEESLISLTHSTDRDSNRFISTLDDKTDGVVIITAQGNIMMINQIATDMFGYEKGELEGKNVSCLMPAPFSQNHNGYLNKYLQGAHGALLNTMQDTVGLTKARTCFPISIGVTHMTGEGQESIFMGIVRPFHDEPDVIRLWVLPKSGTILCVEQRFSDWFGRPAAELAGASFAALGTDSAALQQLIAQAAALREGAVATVTLAAGISGAGGKEARLSSSISSSLEVDAEGGCVSLRTKLNHQYTEPMECAIQAAPAKPEMELYINVEIRLVSPPPALMVVDPTGRLTYANRDLAALLEYPHKQLTTMDLNELIPAPFAQLHREWLSRMTGTRPTAVSCRNGQTVSMLNASGNQVPVTLSMSQREVGDQVHHVVKVLPSTTDAAMSGKRLLLTLDTRGVVEAVDDPTAALFGFPAAQLVGRKVSHFMDGFDGFVEEHGEEELTPLLGALVERSEQQPGLCWRIGVKAPRRNDAAAGAHDAQQGRAQASVSTFFSRRNRDVLKPAVMVLSLISNEDGPDDDEENVRLQLQLWKADLVTGVVEVDQNLIVVKADAAAGLIFGLSHQAMQRHMLHRYLKLVDGADVGDLMGKGPRGAMKGSKGLWKVGLARELSGAHVDGAPLNLLVQAVSRTTQGATRVVAKLSNVKPAIGSRDMFDGLAAAAEAAAALPIADRPVKLTAALDRQPSGAVEEGGGLLQLDGDDDNYSAKSGATGLRRNISRQQSKRSVKHPAAISRQRTQEWLAARDEAAARESGGRNFNRHPVHISPSTTIQMDGGSTIAPEDENLHDDLDGGGGGELAERADAQDVDIAGSSAAGDAVDEEDKFMADFRRHKRLQKLRKLLRSEQAQAATGRFSRFTWYILAAMLVVHCICFAMLVVQINSQRLYIQQVDQNGKAVDMQNILTVRCETIYYCQRPRWYQSDTCQGAVAAEIGYFNTNLATLINAIEGIYLGFNGNLQPLADPACYAYWTDPSIQVEEFADLPDAPHFFNATLSLWEVGMRYIRSAQEVVTSAPTIGWGLNSTRGYQFMIKNGPDSVFDAFTLSLDMLVAWAWNSLGGLQVLLVTLMVIEGVLVQLTGMGAEVLLLQRLRTQHLRTMGIVLSLPSALLRSMAARPCKVDEDDDEAGSEDEDEEFDPAAPTGEQRVEGAAKGKPSEKSVRMFVSADSEPGRNSVIGHGSITEFRRLPAASPRAAARSLWHLIRSKARHLMAYTVVRNFKMNGKRLHPSPAVLLKIWVPLLLWWVAILCIYATSYVQMSQLQQPLAQLNMAQRVMYMTSRVREWAGMTVWEEDNDQVYKWQMLLARDVEELRSNYNTLLYGGILINAILPNSSVAPGTFSSSTLANMFFGEGVCFRANQSACYQPGSQYYQITHSGLDAMMQELMDQSALLALDPPSVTLPDSPRYVYINNVGGFDLYEGMLAATSLFTTSAINAYQQVNTLSIILMAASCVMLLGFCLLAYRPYLRTVRDETDKVCCLLSQLPNDVDIEGNISSILRRELQQRGAEDKAQRGRQDDEAGDA